MWYHLCDCKLAWIFLSNAKIADVWYHRPLNERCKHSSIGRPNMPLKRPLIVARYNGCLHLAGSTTDPTKLVHRYTPNSYKISFITRRWWKYFIHTWQTWENSRDIWKIWCELARFKERWASVKLRPRGCHFSQRQRFQLCYYLRQSYDSSARDFIYSRLTLPRTCMVQFRVTW